jgi:hypothetical protein
MTPEDLFRDATGLSLAHSLDATEAFERRFVRVASEDQAAALALWPPHCYAIDAAPAASYLRITSAVEESGKTQTLEVLRELLGDRCIGGTSVTPSIVFRVRDKRGPVAILLDEIDNTLKDRKDDGARELLALVNDGYRRSATAWRSVGPSHEPKEFAAFGPAAIAGLGSLHPTTESRCIPIVLERKDKGSGERWLPHLLADDIERIRAMLAMWATPEVAAKLKAARPAIPSELRDRHAEVWWGMFAIADLAGGPWPERARRAAVALHVGRDEADTLSVGVRLLSNIRAVFEATGRDRLPTIDLLRGLVDLEEGPWARWWSAEVVRADKDDVPPRKAGADLSRHLHPFRKPDGKPIGPHVVKMPDGSTSRGYLLEDFADAFGRYVSTPSDAEVTHETHVTPLASTVTSVSSVTSPLEQEEDASATVPTPRPHGASAEALDLRPCPSCGAASAAVGYRGHAEGCPNYYGRD